MGHRTRALHAMDGDRMPGRMREAGGWTRANPLPAAAAFAQAAGAAGRTAWRRSRRQASAHPGWTIALVAAAALAGMAWVVQRESRRADREVPPRGRFVEVDGVRLHYVERGSGPVVVLLHGNGSRLEEMLASGLVDRLADEHRVLLFDRPGFGHSTRPQDRPWDAAAQGRLVVRALDALGVDRATLVGHSWGTLVAIAAALDRPERVDGLVLASGYYFPTLRPDFLLASIDAWPIVGTLLRHTTSPLAGRLLWPQVQRLVFRPNRPSAGLGRITPWAFLQPHALRSRSQEGGMLDREARRFARRYRELRPPVAILAGADDPIIPPRKHSARLHAVVPGSTYDVVPGAGHMLHHADPAAVVRAVAQVRARAGQRSGVARAFVPDAVALLPEGDEGAGAAR